MSRTARIIRNIALLALAAFIFPVAAFASPAANPGNLTAPVIELSQVEPNLVAVNDMMYVVTNPGSGEQNAGLLLQADEGSLLSDPNMLPTLLVAVGAGLLILGLSLGKRAGRRVLAPRRLR